MKKFLFIASGLSLLFLSEQVQAQNVIRDFVLDKHADYQPDDHVNRGGIYRMQTGHAGAFKNCDDDLNKMYSPYINWNCRPGSPPRPLANFVSDFDRKLTRFRDGIGGCPSRLTESRNAGLFGPETNERESQAASQRFSTENVSQPELQLNKQPQGSIHTPTPVDDLSAERFEQLRIQRMRR